MATLAGPGVGGGGTDEQFERLAIAKSESDEAILRFMAGLLRYARNEVKR